MPLADDVSVVYAAVWHRGGNGYVLDLYPQEVGKFMIEERRRRCFFARAYVTRSEAEEALRHVAREWHNAPLLRRRRR
jgi:hypothetical protein